MVDLRYSVNLTSRSRIKVAPNFISSTKNYKIWQMYFSTNNNKDKKKKKLAFKKSEHKYNMYKLKDSLLAHF